MAEEIVKKRRARIKVTPVEAPAAEPIAEPIPEAIVTSSNSSQEEECRMVFQGGGAESSA